MSLLLVALTSFLKIPMLIIIISPAFFPKTSNENQNNSNILRMITYVLACVNGLIMVGFSYLIHKLFNIRYPSN
jgi:hypothetical protein